MDFNNFYVKSGEKPLDNVVNDGGFTAIFRKMAFVGDSLSSGEFETLAPDGTTNYNDVFEHSWGQYICRMTGAKGYNFSRGGMTAREYVQSFAEENDFWNKEFASQAYIIAMGCNDFLNFNHPVGELSDIDLNNYENNKDTFIGNYAKIIQRYKEIQPNAKFFLVTMPNETFETEEKNLLKKEHARVLTELAKIFTNTYVIDLFKYVTYDEKFKDNFYLRGHLNPQGYLLTAKIIASYVDYIIRKSPSDFSLVGLI